MDESTKATIEKFQAKLAVLDGQARKIKMAINGLCELEDEPLMYPDADGNTAEAAVRPLTIRPDQFFGRPLATVVREILTPRGQNQQGAIPLDELYALMTQGGFALEGKDDVAKKRTLAITIGKNPAFARIPSTGDVGLADWYPTVKKERKPAASGDAPEILPINGLVGGATTENPPVLNVNTLGTL